MELKHTSYEVLSAPVLTACMSDLSQSVGFYSPVGSHGDSHHPSSLAKGQVCHLWGWEGRGHRRAKEVSYTHFIWAPIQCVCVQKNI